MESADSDITHDPREDTQFHCQAWEHVLQLGRKQTVLHSFGRLRTLSAFALRESDSTEKTDFSRTHNRLTASKSPVYLTLAPEQGASCTGAGTRLVDGRFGWLGCENGRTGRGRQQSMAIIPTRAGQLTLPEVRVAWWNVDSDQPEIASLPTRVIEVRPAPAAAEPGPTERPVSELSPPEVPMESTDAEVAASAEWWPWLTLGLALAWLATLALWFADRRRSATGAAHAEPAPRRADPGKALAEVRNACRSGEPRAVKDALLDWGAATWPDSPPAGLGQLAARCGEPIAERISGLERRLYGKDDAWSADGLVAQGKSTNRDR